MIARVAAVSLLALLLAPGALARAPRILSHEEWKQAVREAGIDPVDVPDPLEPSPAIRDAALRYGRGADALSQLAALQNAMFDETSFVFDYEADVSLTAAEAFEARRGNCVAFTNLFIALGRSRGIPVRLALLEREPRAERDGDLVLVNTHVVAVYSHTGRLTVYDFYRLRRDEVRGIRLLDDLWVTAIFLNNRAIRSLRDGKLEAASATLEQALRLVPDFVGALGNLGVVRRRQGDVDGALDAYRRALEIEPRDASILANLAGLYTSLGRPREAAAALRSADLRAANPWTLLVRGDLEVADGKPEDALAYYRKARRLAPDLVEVWVSIGQAEAERGRMKAARKAVTRALTLSPDDEAALKLRDRLAGTPGQSSLPSRPALRSGFGGSFPSQMLHNTREKSSPGIVTRSFPLTPKVTPFPGISVRTIWSPSATSFITA